MSKLVQESKKTYRKRSTLSKKLLQQCLALQKVGLSQLDAEVYLNLDQCGPAIAPKLAERVNAAPSSIYRSTKKLQRYGFIKIDEFSFGWQFYAVSLDLALAKFAEYQRKQVVDIIIEQRARQPGKNGKISA